MTPAELAALDNDTADDAWRWADETEKGCRADALWDAGEQDVPDRWDVWNELSDDEKAAERQRQLAKWR